MPDPIHSANSLPPEIVETHRLPDDAFTLEEIANLDRVDVVDVEAALAWMRGEGPNPWRSITVPEVRRSL